MRLAVAACAVLSAACHVVFPLVESDDSLDRGLLIHLEFDDPDDLTADSKGNSVICVDDQCPSPGPDRAGNPNKATLFGGTQCLSVMDDPALQPTAFTFAVWANPASQPSFAAELFAKSRASESGLGTFESYVALNGEWSVAVDDRRVSKSAGFDTWHHVAGTFDGVMLVLYFDGVLEMMSAKFEPAAYTSDPFSIGCDLDPPGAHLGFLIGELDDLRFYDRPLRPDEIVAVYNAEP